MYLIRVSHGLIEARTDIVELHSDEHAVRVARLTLEREAAKRENARELSVLVGRGAEPQTTWLGSWHWDGKPAWHE